jgi:transposase InsO family protein
MKMHGLLLTRSGKLPERHNVGKIITMRSDLRYCSDTMEIHCWNGEEVHVAFSLDCHDREAISYVAKPYDLNHEDIQDLMDKTVVQRFGPLVERLPHPIEWLSDNGPQYIARETKSYGQDWGFIVCNTPAYSPESNGMSEAFVKTFKRDYVYTHELPDSETVIRQLASWFEDYNTVAPHSGIGYLSPREYRQNMRKSEALGCPINNDCGSRQPAAWREIEEKKQTAWCCLSTRCQT